MWPCLSLISPMPTLMLEKLIHSTILIHKWAPHLWFTLFHICKQLLTSLGSSKQWCNWNGIKLREIGPEECVKFWKRCIQISWFNLFCALYISSLHLQYSISGTSSTSISEGDVQICERMFDVSLSLETRICSILKIWASFAVLLHLKIQI
jgi:hypothetical protein